MVAFAQEPLAEILKPSRELYVHAKFADRATTRGGENSRPKGGKPREAEFYQPFADWIVNELEECTRAIPPGGCTFGSKWGTPDVIGVRAPAMGSLIAFPTEIVSAEVKTETSKLIVAFGQAIAYRLFSHKIYLVVPTDSAEEDLARLDVLSRIVGIGLILFDAGSVEDPKFAIRVRPQKHEPDGFYLNDCVRHVQERLFRRRARARGILKRDDARTSN